MDEDWGLHALVKHFTTTTAATTSAAVTTNNSIKCIEHQQNYSYEENKIYFENNDIFKPNNNYNPFEELEQLYKPFYPNPKSPSSSSLSISTISTPPKFTEPTPKSLHPKINKISSNNPVIAANFASRSKRRKNQQKKIVQQVTADSLSDDIWAWRKYGQKPIKGSLYPRNYYRCSSSKGCLARKQVERSDSDPNMFILTYTGEHSHPRPTHRNSLAGSTRNKYGTTLSSTSTVTVTEEDEKSEHTPSLSPTTPLLPELQLQDSKISGTGDNTGDEFEDEIIDDEELKGEDVLIPNTMMSNEDIFMGLEELNRH